MKVRATIDRHFLDRMGACPPAISAFLTAFGLGRPRITLANLRRFLEVSPYTTGYFCTLGYWLFAPQLHQAWELQWLKCYTNPAECSAIFMRFYRRTLQIAARSSARRTTSRVRRAA